MKRMPDKRVKVRVEHVQKTFYERFLQALRRHTEDQNQKFVIYKAHAGLKNYPLEVRSIADLKHIHGIGETLAIRCFSAWEAACANATTNLDLKTVRKLTDDDFLRFANGSKKRNTPSVTHSCTTAPEVSAKSKNPRSEKSQKITTKAPRIVPERSESVGAPEERESQVLNGENTNPASSSADKAPLEDMEYVTCYPRDQAEVILIADLRENNAMFRGDTVVECLAASNYRVEMRPLSVGDYVWIARKIDGTEMVLDWIVERKTWSDLQQSIRSGRYQEQKQRLRRSPMKNRVYLVEGTLIPQYASCEQALATTMVTDGFMIQKCRSPQDSSQFLLKITEYLKTNVLTRQLTGMTFRCFQELSKKTHVEFVRDVWVRQLMVCPGMSSERAQIVASRFPSMSSMMELYSRLQPEQAKLALSSAVPGITNALSAQMSKFFSTTLQQ